MPVNFRLPDTLSGAGGNDRLSDIYGYNYLLGGAGDDVFVTRTSANIAEQPDTISGGSGFDRAQLDSIDSTASIEELLE